jgi:esterase
MMEMHFRSYGSGPSLVILHGLFGSLNNWHSHAIALASNFRVYTVDQRNHGSSPHASAMSYPAMAGDLKEFIEAHHLGPTLLLGHSMGGRTAMQLALTSPGLVRKLAVVDIRPQADPPVHEHILAAVRNLDLPLVRSRDDADAMLTADVPDSAERQLLLTNLKRDSNGAYRWRTNVEAIGANYSALIGAVPAVGRYSGRTLFVTGEKSSHIVDADKPGILELFPGAGFVEIPGAGHWVQADAPEEFRRVVREFFES